MLRALKAASGAATTASLDEACRGRNTSKSDESSQLPWAAMLTSTDLDEGDEGLAGEPDTGGFLWLAISSAAHSPLFQQGAVLAGAWGFPP